MNKTHFLSTLALLLLISGCGSKSPPKPSALLFNGSQPISEPADFMWRDDVDWATDILSRNVFINIEPISLCNYFYDEENCIDKVHYTHWKNTPVKGYLRLDTNIYYSRTRYSRPYHTFERATQVKEFIKQLDLTDPKNTFVVKVITQSKFKVKGSKKLPADPKGYYIFGYLKVPLAGKTKSKYNELRIPINWGSEYELRSKNREWKDITEKRTEVAFKSGGMRKISSATTTLHDNYYILAKGIPEMMGWLKPGAKSELLAQKENFKIKLKSVKKERNRVAKAKEKAKRKAAFLQSLANKKKLKIETRIKKTWPHQSF